jgi:Putative bacterial sensory transduction regulator
MPRYRFAWSNIPPELLKQLSTDLMLEGEPADVLRRRFGARPKPAFVQETWPTLLEGWLTADSASRQYVAEELRAMGLGRPEISVRSKQGQLDYLRSCRNALTLREVVLTAFLAAGETTQIETPIARPETSVREPPRERPREGQPATVASQETTGSDGGSHAANLDDWVVETLKAALKVPDISRDSDGDIPVPRGSSMLYIRPHDRESPFLEIFSPLIHDFRMSPEIYEAVNAINTQVPMAKAVVVGDGRVVLLSLMLLTDTLSATELLFSIDLVSGAADHFDTLLQKRFGGVTQLTDDDDDSIDV